MANLKDLIVNGAARIIGKTYSSEFVGNVTGNVTGDVTGNLTGNAATASKLGTATVGGDTKPIYLKAGVATAVSNPVIPLVSNGDMSGADVSTVQGAGVLLKDETTGTVWNIHTHADNLRMFNGSTEKILSENGHTHSYAGSSSVGGPATDFVAEAADNSDNKERYVYFAYDNSTYNNPNPAQITKGRAVVDSAFTYNSGTDTLTAGTFKGSLSGNATTATTADKTAYGISVGDGVSSTAAISGWKGSEAKTLAIKGTSPITTTATANTITITHNKGGANVSKGDTANQTPGFGGTFKVTSATVDVYGHTTTLADHTVTIPSNVATGDVNGLMSSADKSKLDSVASGAEVNQNAFSNVTVGSTTISAGSKTDTLTLAAGNNITLTPDSKTVNISVTGLGTNAYSSTSYLPSAGGIMTGNIDRSTYHGGGWINGRDNAAIKTSSSIDSSSFAPIVSAKTQGGSWDLGPCHPNENFYFSYATDSNYNAGTNTTNSSIYFTNSGGIYAGAVYNAVWNDLVDCMEVPEDTLLEYGYCYSWDSNSVVKSSRSSKNCIGIHSNTAGFVMGEKKTKTIRAAVAGFVLAYVDKLYPEGTPLTWGDNGVLTKCSSLKRILHPERVIATFYKEEKEEKWHDLLVSGRHWVKIV